MSLHDQARRLELRNGDVVCLPADTCEEDFRAFAAQLSEMHRGLRVMIVLGDVCSLDEAAMNAAGWYRK